MFVVVIVVVVWLTAFVIANTCKRNAPVRHTNATSTAMLVCAVFGISVFVVALSGVA